MLGLSRSRATAAMLFLRDQVNFVPVLDPLQHVKESQFLLPPLPSDPLHTVYLQGGRFPKTGV